ncbi:hypothetical protein [Nocardia salmonicida]|nr:hypothetical protein [Nocardia salmonicida]
MRLSELVEHDQARLQRSGLLRREDVLNGRADDPDKDPGRVFVIPPLTS